LEYQNIPTNVFKAIFWLEPINLTKSIGYNAKELNEIRKLIIDNVEILKVKWHEYFNI
jgi:hypothetical protein